MIDRKNIGILGFILTIFLGAGLLYLLYQSEVNSENDFTAIDESEIRKELQAEFAEVYAKEEVTKGGVVEVELTAQESAVELIDGYSTNIWSYNGEVPGPSIRMKLGDTLKVTLKNELSQPTTIHWHGVRVPNDMDGVPELNQEAVAPGESFVYEFTPKDAGTFWYHPHVRSAEQVERGLYGTVIVEEPEAPAYDQDIVWVVDDWSLMKDGQIFPRFVTGHDLMHDGRWGNVITVNGSVDEQVDVSPGETIRLRMVNTSNGRIYRLQFGALKAEALAVDGLAAKKAFNPQGFELAPGNRIDVAITIPEGSAGKTFTITDEFTRRPNRLGVLNVKESAQSDTRKSDILFPYNDAIPEWSAAHQLRPDKVYTLDASRGGMHGIEWTINGKAYPEYDPITLSYNTFNKIRFENKSGRLHPMHLHGQFFKVIARNGVPVDEPYMRDTVLVHGKETVDIGIVPMDKGVWANHCHILEHAEAGMMTILEVK